MKHVPSQTVVYYILNRINGKLYIGSTARYGFRKRWYFHKRDLRLGVHYNSHLQSAWNKYGPNAFLFSILLRCSPEECIKWEQEFLECFQSYKDGYGYNISPTAGSTLGAKWGPLTPKQKQQRSKASKDRWDNPEYKKRMTEKIRQAMAAPEYKENHRAAMQKIVTSEEYLVGLSKRSKKMWEERTEEERQKVGESISIATKSRYENPEERRKTSEAIRKGWQNKVWYQKSCTHCGTIYKTPFPTRSKYCSRKCDQQARRARQ